MSEANLQIVKNLYAAFGRGDLPAALDMISPDVTWAMVGREGDIPMAGARRSLAGVAEFFRVLRETQELKAFEPQAFAAGGDRVFVKGRSEWTMRRSGVSGEGEWVHVYTLRGGKVIAYTGHHDTAHLAEAYRGVPAGRGASADKAEPNIAIVKEGYGAFLRGDVPSLLALVADDVRWEFVGREGDVPMAGVRHGKAGVAEFFQRLIETQQVTKFETRRVFGEGDTVVALGHAEWIMNPNGVAGANDFVHVFTIRDGKIAAYRAYQDTGMLAEAYHAKPQARAGASR